jgi:hypothetical protein
VCVVVVVVCVGWGGVGWVGVGVGGERCCSSAGLVAWQGQRLGGGGSVALCLSQQAGRRTGGWRPPRLAPSKRRPSNDVRPQAWSTNFKQKLACGGVLITPVKVWGRGGRGRGQRKGQHSS